jgi:hypothetical protein
VSFHSELCVVLRAASYVVPYFWCRLHNVQCCGSLLLDWCADATGDTCRLCRQTHLLNQLAYCCRLTITAFDLAVVAQGEVQLRLVRASL